MVIITVVINPAKGKLINLIIRVEYSYLDRSRQSLRSCDEELWLNE